MSAHEIRVALLSVRTAPACAARERILARRDCVRLALSECARLAGVADARFQQDEHGVPVAHGAWSWSASHARDWVAAAIAREAIGVDVEKIALPRDEIVDATLSEGEAELLGGRGALEFTRAWTAKESVLKRARVGLAGLSGCRIVELRGELGLVLRHRGAASFVEQHVVDGHLAALAVENPLARARWIVLAAAQEVRA